MAFEDGKRSITLPAAGDLSASQFCFVEANADGRAALVGTLGAHADGVLQNKPSALGRDAEVAIGGVVKVLCGGPVTRGGPVSSSAAGKAVNATTGHIILGTALETGADGSIIAVLFNPRGAA